MSSVRRKALQVNAELKERAALKVEREKMIRIINAMLIRVSASVKRPDGP